MVSMENVKPESRKPGKNVISKPNWYACTCEREPAETQIPEHSAHKRNTHVETASTKKLPRTATVTEITESTSPTTKYASILPSTISVGRSGVESTCSMVPISHSRAMVSDVSCPARIVRITAISPGTTKFLDSSEILSQTRSRASTIPGGRTPRRFNTPARTPA